MLPRNRQGFKGGFFAALLILVSCISFSTVSLGAQTDAGARYRISVVTMGPGRSLFTRYGHTAIWVSDRNTDIQKLYNFGEFDYAQTGLVRKFLFGELRYWVSTSSFESLKKKFKKNDRSLTVQTLALTPLETATLLELLNRAVLPENRYYLYHHYKANCCTKVRDAVNQATGGLIATVHHNPSETFRYWTKRSTAFSPLLRLFFQLILNDRVDAPITSFDAQYLPVNFSRALDETKRAVGQPLVKQKQHLFPDRYEPESSPAIQWAIIALFIALLTALTAAPCLFPNRRLAYRLFGGGLALFGLVNGIAGSLLVFLRCITPYPDLHADENLLLFLPTHLVLVVCGMAVLWKKSVSCGIHRFLSIYLKAAAFSAILDLLLKLGPFHQDNYIFIASDLYFIGLITFSLKKMDRPQRCFSPQAEH